MSKDVTKEFCLTNTTAEMDQIPSKCLKEATIVLAYLWPKVLNYPLARRM